MNRLMEFAIDKLLEQVGKDKVYKIEYLPKQGGLYIKTKMTLENIIKAYYNTDIILKISDIGEEEK